MNFELDDEQALLQNTMRDFVAGELEPFLATFPQAPLPRDAVLRILQMLKPFGLLNARVPVEDGGAGMTNVELGILYEQLPPDVAMDVSANDVIAMRICQGGSEELKERYVGALAEGEIMAGSAISEPDTGSDVTSISTSATPEGDGYVLDGTKLWASHATIADVLLVAASLGRDERGRSVVGRFLIDTREHPIDARDLEMLGLKRHHLGELTLERHPVPGANLVGEPGDGVEKLTRTWLSARALFGLMSVNIMQRAFDLSVAYARERTQFGKPIGAFQLVQELIVEMSILIDNSRFLSYRALHLLDQGRPARLESSQAKLYATEAVVRVTDLAIQVHGAIGLSCEHSLEELYRDARMLSVPDGTTQMQKLMAGREILGISAIR